MTTTTETKRNDPVYRLAGSVRTACRAENGVVLDIARGRMFRLNQVGSRILGLVKQGLREPEIVDAMMQEFGIGFEAAVQDAREFFETLHRLAVIEKHPAEAAISDGRPTK